MAWLILLHFLMGVLVGTLGSFLWIYWYSFSRL